MVLPNFLIVGAVKAGTTSLYRYLRQHPEIFMPTNKEPHHFAPHKWCNHSAMQYEDYVALFKGAHNYQARGEASTGYLYYPESPQMIYQKIPDCKIVVILRDPISRAFSGYCHEVQEGMESISFEQALAEEKQALRIVNGGDFSFNYIKQTKVGENIRQYISQFGAHNVHFCLLEDLISAPKVTMQNLFKFLQVDESFVGDWKYRHNSSGLPRSKILHDWLSNDGIVQRMLGDSSNMSWLDSMRLRLLDWNLSQTNKPVLSAQTKRQLSQEFEPEVRCLEQLLDRNLTHWLVN